jgi:hypothetical protein
MVFGKSYLSSEYLDDLSGGLEVAIGAQSSLVVILTSFGDRAPGDLIILPAHSNRVNGIVAR